jgi:hypothetical protein
MYSVVHSSLVGGYFELSLIHLLKTRRRLPINPKGMVVLFRSDIITFSLLFLS